VLTAYRAGSRGDRVANATAFGMLAIPNFALALVLAYYVGVELGWLPVSGYAKPSEDLGEHIRRMAMPAISLAVGQIAVYMRLLRSDMIATLQEDFITMAKSKGVSPRRVLWRHALRPSSLTLLTVAGLNVGTLIGGAVIIEVIFSLPGIGTLLFEAISARQYIALQSLVAIIAVGYVLVNFLVDVLYAVLDPRIRHARS
jgi:peptide/nickel transport system permease protein